MNYFKWPALLAGVILFPLSQLRSQTQSFTIHTIAFYNVENLYDTIRDFTIFDQEWTPQGNQAWTTAKYRQKIKNLARVMSQIGTDEHRSMPTVIGLAEIENREVLQDLIKDPQLRAGRYGIVHYDSPDRRGIDVAFLYRKDSFIPTHTSKIPLYIYEAGAKNNSRAGKRKRVYTRDLLLVTGLLDGEEISFLVNHWPSRFGGEKRSSPFREAAAALNKKVLDSLYAINSAAKIVVMGDFNDGPYNKSIKEVLGAQGDRSQVPSGGLYNPMQQMAKEGIGSLAYRDAWDLFDQLLISQPLLERDYTSFRFWKAAVFKKNFMVQHEGPYAGYPLRNSNGRVGFSDHFPVCIFLIRLYQ